MSQQAQQPQGSATSASGPPLSSASSKHSLENKHQGSTPNLASNEGRNPVASEWEKQDQSQGVAARPPGGALPNYSFGFWDPQLAGMRKEYIINMARLTVLISVLIWCVVTIYWGSLWKSSDLAHNLNGWVINRDPSGAIGSNITGAIMSSNNLQSPHLTWTTIAPQVYPTASSIEQAVAVDQKVWVVVEIRENATALLAAARANPSTTTWDPNGAINVYYSEARNQQTVDGLVLNSVRGLFNGVLPNVERNSLVEWLSANANNAAAISTAVTNAATLANPLVANYINLRPWDKPVAIAPSFVGLIYLVIIAFNVTMGNFGMRQGIQRKLRMRSFILMRILAPVTTYIFLSCMFSLINIPFQLNFGSMGYGYGAGFMVWWCFTFLAMCVLGLVTEAFLAIVGQRFVGFALVFLIILNVSVANLPIQLQVSLFQYGYAMPFYNVRLAYVTIIFNAGRHIDLLKYMGILLAWLLVVVLTLPVWVWLERRTERKAPVQASGPPAARAGADAA